MIYILLISFPFLVSLIFFLSLAGEYMFRYIRDSPFRRPQPQNPSESYTSLDKNARFTWDTRIKALVGGLSLICLFIFIR